MWAAKPQRPWLCIWGASCHHLCCPLALLILTRLPCFALLLSILVPGCHLFNDPGSAPVSDRQKPACYSPSCQPCLGLLGPKCTPSSPSLCNHTLVRCQHCSRSVCFGENKNLNSVVWLSHLFFPTPSFSRRGQLIHRQSSDCFSSLWFVLAMPLTWLLLQAFFATCNVFPLSNSFKFSLPHEWSQDTSTFTTPHLCKSN